MTGGYSTSPKAYVASSTEQATLANTKPTSASRLEELLFSLTSAVDGVETNTNTVSYSTGRLTGSYETHKNSPEVGDAAFNSLLDRLSFQISRLNEVSVRLLMISNTLQENV